MARVGNRPTRLEYEWCTLVLDRYDRRAHYSLAGQLEMTNLVHREEIAARIARHLGMEHDEAYAMAWGDICRGWEQEGVAVCPSCKVPTSQPT